MICWISTDVTDEMQAELRRMFPLETGGILVGYIGANGDRVVTQIVGPGPNAKHERYNFEPDFEYQRKAFDDIWAMGDGKETYLGDWHTHPGGPCWPSDLDCKCMDSIAANKEAQAPQPLMIILGTNPVSTGAYVRLDDVQRIDVMEYKR